MPEPIELNWNGGRATITLNRPDRANVLDSDASAVLGRIVSELAERAEVGRLRAVLLHGRGPQFSDGGDIREFASAGDELAALLDRGIPPLHRAIDTLTSLPVPIVCAVNGSLGGGGIGLALAADIVLASECARLRGGYSDIGLSPDVGVSWALARLAGPMRAKQILFTNRTYSAQECLAMGLFVEIFPADELLPAATRLVDQLARSSPHSLARIKSLVDGAATRGLREQLELEHRAMVECAASADAAEAVRAFVAKPEYRGSAMN